MQVHEECSIRCDDIERTLNQAKTQWRSLEDELGRAEEAFLTKRLESWKKWFALEEGDLSMWGEGGLRHHVRSRLHDLLLSPLVARMATKIGYVPIEPPPEEAAPPDGGGEAVAAEDELRSNEVLSALLGHHSSKIKVVVAKARKQDDELGKKIRKTEKDERKKGVVALGMQDTKKVAALKRQRPEIWEEAQKVVERLVTPCRLLKEFLKDELTAQKKSSMLLAVPVIVVRAVCDWYFQKSMLGYDQLEQWWNETKATLRADPTLWERLREKEGVILRRIDGGIEDIGTGRRNYSLYASFGGSEQEVTNLLNSAPEEGQDPEDIPPKLQTQILLLVHEVSMMHQRLKAMRDGALWRVVEEAQSIHRKMNEAGETKETPWQATSVEDGIRVFREVLKLSEATEQQGEDGSDVEDGALLAMKRIEDLITGTAELRSYLEQDAGLAEESAAGATAALQAVIDRAGGLVEDLLVLLDEPSKELAKGWLADYRKFLGEGSGLGEKLDAAMTELPLKSDNWLKAAERRTRTRWLSFARGLQVFLGDSGLHGEVAEPLARAAGVAAAAAAATGVAHVATVTAGGEETGAGTVAAVAPSSPQHSAAAAAATLRETRKKLDLEGISMPLSPRPAMSSSSSPSFRPPDRRQSQEPMPSVSEAGAFVPQPAGTPGNGEGLKANFLTGWRPDTPSTTCEDAEAGGRGTPSAKFVDGSLVQPRPGSGSRLAPLGQTSPTSRRRGNGGNPGFGPL
mmetsp:Transcript_56978/g.144590  ORF Transcript_56978/g.144590 Transcript_56978/m.144590 type:complete len:741 (+) Transcript_56978:137-2359(+)